MTPPPAALGAASLGATADGAATDGAADGAAGVLHPTMTITDPATRPILKMRDMFVALLARSRNVLPSRRRLRRRHVTAVLLHRTRSRAHLPSSRVLVRRSRRTAPRMIRPFTICCEKGETPRRFRRLFIAATTAAPTTVPP